MRRREVITLLGGMAAAWPFGARAQQSDRVRRIGLLIGAADDADMRAMHEAFRQGMQQLGWIDGRNLQIDARFGAADPVRGRKYAAELVALSPDVILSTGRSRPDRGRVRVSCSRSCVVNPASRLALFA